MAAQVELEPGVVSGRLHLSPLTDSSNKTLMEDSPIISSDPKKPIPGPKPRLTPKPFAIQRNATIRPILAPKPQPKPKPESLTRPEPPSKPKLPSPAVKSGTKPTSGPSSSPEDKPDHSSPLNDPDNPKPSETGGLVRRTSLGPSASQSKPTEWPLRSKTGPSITRAKSLGFLSGVGLEEDVSKVVDVVVRRPQETRSSRPRPVSATFLPEQTTSSSSAPNQVNRRPLLTDLTAKFESVTQRQPALGDSSKENTPETPAGEDGVRRREKHHTDLDAKLLERAGSGIKRRISLLMDSSSSTFSVPATRVDEPRSPAPQLADTDGAVGVKQRIKELTEDLSPASTPPQKPLFKPRPLPTDRTKRFASDAESTSPSEFKGVQEGAEELGKKSKNLLSTGEAKPQEDQNVTGGVQTVRAALFENVVEKHSIQMMEDANSSLVKPTPRQRLSLRTKGSGLFSSPDDEGDGSLVKSLASPSSPKRIDHVFDMVTMVEESRAVSENIPAAHLEEKALTLRRSNGGERLQQPFLNDGITGNEENSFTQGSNNFLKDKDRQSTGSLTEKSNTRVLRVGALPKWEDPFFDGERGLEIEKQREIVKDMEEVIRRQTEVYKAAKADIEENKLENEAEMERVPALREPKVPETEDQQMMRPKTTYFALSGQMNEVVHQSAGIDEERMFGSDIRGIAKDGVKPEMTFEDFSVKIGQRGFHNRAPSMRRNQSSEPSFRKSSPEALQIAEVAQWQTGPQKTMEQESEEQKRAEYENMKELKRQHELEKERQRERERQRELERERERQRELERERERQRELERERERQRELERERERQRELERERERQRELEIERERQKELEIERERQKELEIERERQKELEIERERQRELERERERQRELERERERQRELERERERQRELERERERQRELERERERQRELERERERQRELERERERQRELEREREMERERERQREMERERERQKELERQRERQKEMERQQELERLKEIERQKQFEKERQNQIESEMRRQIELGREKERLLEMERIKLQEYERHQEMEKDRKRQLELNRVREIERQTQIESERQRDLEKQKEQEKQKEMERWMQSEKQKKLKRDEQRLLDDLKNVEDLERRQLLEFQLHKDSERENRPTRRDQERVEVGQREAEQGKRTAESSLRPQVLDLDNVSLGDRFGTSLSSDQSPTPRWKQPSNRDEGPYKPSILDVDSFKNQTQSLDAFGMTAFSSSDPGKAKPMTRTSGAKSLSPIRPQSLLQNLQRDVPSQSKMQAPSKSALSEQARLPPPLQPQILNQAVPVETERLKPQIQSQSVPSDWTHGTHQFDTWNISQGEVAVDEPTWLSSTEIPKNSFGGRPPSVEQILQRQDARSTGPFSTSLAPSQTPALTPGQSSGLIRPMVPLQMPTPSHATSPGHILTPERISNADSLFAGGRRENQTALSKLVPEPSWSPSWDPLSQEPSQGTTEHQSRMRSRSVNQRSALVETSVDGPLARIRSRSAHRDKRQDSWEQLKSGGQDECKDTDTLVQETDSQYGTWGTGLHTDDSLTPVTPSDSNFTPSPRKPSLPHTPDQLNQDEQEEPLNFPQSTTVLLDSSAQRSKAQLSKSCRRRRAPPSRAARHSAVLPDSLDITTEEWRFKDSTEDKPDSAKQQDEESDEEEPTRSADARTSSSSASSQSQRVSLFPGMDPSALMAQLKKRGESESQTDGPSPAQLSRSPKSPFLGRASRVLPPVGGKENGEESSSPQWLKELKTKKRFSQIESDS
ncbi:calponin homology domain-containing protein DDB_G0272472 [Clarias gariepinus]|uniref:calponin homology domain-containing protein DDB_G0272472 n=1 Tax=Clarias gariepinus TaxID=13013 RepID=UPI00234E2BA8|nr:calponin homology domain-containing protein DDB_G0272472 [Clarias gariepinus]XP_053359518.1 calponin homology domain-containing protein DDB_G0272472 [Clarias gariepinus]